MNLEKREHWSNCCKENFSLTLRFTSRSKTVLEEMDQSTPTGFDKNHKKHIKVKYDIKRNYRNCSIKMCKIWTTRFDKNHKKHIKDKKDTQTNNRNCSIKMWNVWTSMRRWGQKGM